MSYPNPSHVVVIVGGAVAGSEAALQLAERGVICIVLDQNERPYGKIEDGLPRWHVELRRQEEKRIDDKLSRPGVHFVPRTRLGRDLDLAEIRSWKPSAIVLANGAWRDRSLPLPGIDRFLGKGFAYQNSFVYWFNHYIEADYHGPEFCPLDGSTVIGGGLASLDVIKILMLETVTRALAQRGETVDILEMEHQGCRKILEQKRMTLQDLGLRGCTLFYRRRIEDMPVAETPEDAPAERVAKSEMVRRKLMKNFAEKYLFQFESQRAPVGYIAENGRLQGLRMAVTRIENRRAIVMDSTAYDVPTPLVISSIGSIPEPIPGIGMEGETYQIKDPETGEVEGNDEIFVIGNAVTGKGNIMVSRKHGRTVSQRMIEQYLFGVSSGYEQVFLDSAAEARQKMAAVAARISGQAPLSRERVSGILRSIKSLQERAGYSGDYHQWIERSRH